MKYPAAAPIDEYIQNLTGVPATNAKPNGTNSSNNTLLDIRKPHIIKNILILENEINSLYFVLKDSSFIILHHPWTYIILLDF